MSQLSKTDVPKTVENKQGWLNLHRRLYDWVLHWAETPYGIPALIILSFCESSFFPIPPDVLLIALVLGKTSRWWHMALACSIASVVGGVAGYGIGVFAWETIGKWIMENILHIQLVLVNGRPDIALPAYVTTMFGEGLGGKYLFEVYDIWNAWIVFIFGLTPLPYKLVTITAGVARVDLGVFIITSIASRSLRFFLVAYVLKLIGEPAKQFIERHFNTLTIVFVILLIGGFFVLKFLF